jgi:hypothetical protein
MKTDFSTSALEKFSGCDGGDPGSPEFPSVWVFGIEYANDNRVRSDIRPPVQCDDEYEISRKLTYRFNRYVFKLLAALDNHDVDSYEAFAHKKQPFGKNSRGYFKGNLYPISCSNLETWTQEAIDETGFSSKVDYSTWCDEHRLSTIKRWVDEYQPKTFIGIGTIFEKQFSKAYFGKQIALEEYQFRANGLNKRILFKNVDGKLLVVVPQPSPSGLSTPESFKIAGQFIRQQL